MFCAVLGINPKFYVKFMEKKEEILYDKDWFDKTMKCTIGNMRSCTRAISGAEGVGTEAHEKQEVRNAV